jgi:hypothetical protein
MDTVLVQFTDARRRLTVRVVEIGGTVRFGRGEPAVPVDVALDDPGVPRLAGEIGAVGDYWTLTNLSRDRTYAVENPEGAGEHIKVPARRIASPIPFEFSRVVLPVRQTFVSFYVFAPRHAYAENHRELAEAGEPTLAAFPLDESSKYFLVLVALCEPRLRDESHVDIPTVEAVVERLRSHPSCGSLSTAAVTFHIDYLARVKLRVKDDSVDGASKRLESKRAALVSLALRFNLVSEDHLRLLPHRSRTMVAAGSHAYR